jgi:hypothetical protein
MFFKYRPYFFLERRRPLPIIDPPNIHPYARDTNCLFARPAAISPSTSFSSLSTTLPIAIITAVQIKDLNPRGIRHRRKPPCPSPSTSTTSSFSLATVARSSDPPHGPHTFNPLSPLLNNNLPDFDALIEARRDEADSTAAILHIGSIPWRQI